MASSINFRDEYLKAAKFSYPKFMPTTISIFYPVWNIYRDSLKNIVVKYPLFFNWINIPEHYSGVSGIPFTDMYRVDVFGCIWRTRIEGYIGEVVKHPLSEFSKLLEFRLPDPSVGVPTESGLPKPIVPWDEVFSGMEKAREKGLPVVAWLPHGFLFLRLIYLMGFSNLFIAMYKRDERLYRLIEMLTDYYIELIEIYRRGFSYIDVFSFGDDLGGEDRPLINPRLFAEYIGSAYRKIFSKAKSSGALIRLHTDGRVVELWNQLLDVGVDILNIQDKPNTIENIARLRGRVCIDLDINRRLLAFGSPEEVGRYIKNVVEVFRDPKGGFMLYLEFHPPAKLESIEEVAKVLQESIWLK